jgi:hypothetical protein
MRSKRIVLNLDYSVYRTSFLAIISSYPTSTFTLLATENEGGSCTPRTDLFLVNDSYYVIIEYAPYPFKKTSIRVFGDDDISIDIHFRAAFCLAGWNEVPSDDGFSKIHIDEISIKDMLDLIQRVEYRGMNNFLF